MKTCKKCGVDRPLDQFPVVKGKFVSPCKPCRLEYRKTVQKDYRAGYFRDRAATPDRKQYMIDRKKKWPAYLASKLSTAKSGAKKRGILFELTTEHLIQLFENQNGKCALTGREFCIDRSPGHMLSIDRIKGELGYVPGNVRLVVFEVNAARGSGDDDALISLATDILKHHRLL